MSDERHALWMRPELFLSIHYEELVAAEVCGEWMLVVCISPLETNKILVTNLVISEASEKIVVVSEAGLAFPLGDERSMVGEILHMKFQVFVLY